VNRAVTGVRRTQKGRAGADVVSSGRLRHPKRFKLSICRHPLQEAFWAIRCSEPEKAMLGDEVAVANIECRAEVKQSFAWILRTSTMSIREDLWTSGQPSPLSERRLDLGRNANLRFSIRSTMDGPLPVIRSVRSYPASGLAYFPGRAGCDARAPSWLQPSSPDVKRRGFFRCGSLTARFKPMPHATCLVTFAIPSLIGSAASIATFWAIAASSFD
jgi:hypothetical protein